MFKSFIALLFFLILFAGCDSKSSVSEFPMIVYGEPTFVDKISDTEEWYDDANNDVLEMRVTIPTPNSSFCSPWDNQSALPRPCTLDDINHDIDPNDDYEPVLNVIMTTDTFFSAVPNATLKIRGDYSRTLQQKSYAIKLYSKTNLFLSQRKFQINKHQSDRSRVRNKLSFDLFRTIPNITSLKLQFINLKIDENGTGNFVDYGFFTHAEAMRKEYLVNRGWNEDDNIYNAVDCMFEPRDELATDAYGVPLNQELFDTVLEVKRGTHHLKVNEMINAVYNTADIDAVIEKYFNRDNYITWLAINLVLSNKDTTYHNFYLYNPLYSDKFYFLPWDYDGAWAKEKYLGKNEYGISVWWESPLHRKFLSIKKNRDDVYAMAEELRAKYITPEIIKDKVALYEPSVRPFVSVFPDSQNNSDDTWVDSSNQLSENIDANMNLYKSVIGHPMPFREYVSYENGRLDINWTESVDLEGDKIVYDVKVATDSNISNIILEADNIDALEYLQDINLASDTYYLQVISKEEQNASHYQIAFDQIDDDGTKYGIVEFEVK